VRGDRGAGNIPVPDGRARFHWAPFYASDI
jgi:hypothetical protein